MVLGVILFCYEKESKKRITTMYIRLYRKTVSFFSEKIKTADRQKKGAWERAPML